MARQNKTMTPDEAAMRLLLDGNQKGLERLQKRVTDVTQGRVECPECGDQGPHDDNGASGEELAFACHACGKHFHPEPIEVDADSGELR